LTNHLNEAAARHRRLEAALKALDDAVREPWTAPDDDPLFICALGWRSGSTLLQRIVMTDPSILVWGEPMDKLGLLDRIVDSVGQASPEFPPAEQFLSHRRDVDLTRDWIANLMPDAGDFKAGLRSLFDTWLAAPARRRGFTRWGVKEVRWSGQHATVLRWLYPRSRIVVLARHPVDAFQSMTRLGWDFWVRLPDRPVSDLDSFARFWNAMALSWVEAARPLGAEVLRYEDLVVGDAGFLESLARRLGLALQSGQALRARVGAAPDGPRLSDGEKARIAELTAPGRAAFLYAE
jgi:hypothetical protein